jgi:hypothetical protein
MVQTGEGGMELARFNRDGSWQIFNNRQSQRLIDLNQPVQLTMPVTIATTGDPREIETVFEQTIMPKVNRALQRARSGRRMLA